MSMFHTILFMVITFTSLNLNSTQEGENMGILQKQPEFQLKIEGVGLFYKVEVNGSEVFRQRYEELQTSTYVPVNQFMISGESTRFS